MTETTMASEPRLVRSLAYRTGVVAKSVMLVVVLTISVLFATPWPNLVLALLLGAYLLRLEAQALARFLAPLIVVLAFIFLFAAIDPSRGGDSAVLGHAWLGGRLPITWAGIVHGANLSLRILVMVCASAIWVLTTPVEEVIDVLQRLAVPQVIVFIIGTALRFVPMMTMRMQQIRDAQQVRGTRLDSRGPVGAVRAHLAIVVPLLTSGIRMSEDLAAAMLSRGYGACVRPTRLGDLEWTVRDGLLIVASLLLLGVAIWLRCGSVV